MNKKSNGNKQSPGGIKEVREIIFGDYLNNMQVQIDELKKENKDLKQQLKAAENNLLNSDNLIGELKGKVSDCFSDNDKLEKYLKKVESSILQKIKEIDSAKIDKNQIGQAFIEWGTRVKQDPNS